MRKLLASRQPPSKIDHPNVQASHLQIRQTSVTSGELCREVLQMRCQTQIRELIDALMVYEGVGI